MRHLQIARREVELVPREPLVRFARFHPFYERNGLAKWDNSHANKNRVEPGPLILCCAGTPCAGLPPDLGWAVLTGGPQDRLHCRLLLAQSNLPLGDHYFKP